MKVVVLASGSKGNVTFIETKKHKLLLDFGMSITYVKNKLNNINVSLESIDYIFISHVHVDHIKGLPILIKRYQPTICLTEEMFSELPDLEEYNHILVYEDELILDDIRIETIKTSHDTTDSRGFIVTSENESVVYLTDTGYLNNKHFTKLKNKEYYLFESNHDIHKLMNGPYPKWLRSRILSDYGHLSNKDASIYLSKLIGKNTKRIVLMHLSKENNSEELALNTIFETFKDHSINFDDIKCARQDEMLEVQK